MPENLLSRIKAGMQITILTTPLNPAVPHTRVTGRAVMRGPAGWVINTGGEHGTPAIADEENIVHIPALKYGRKL